MEQSEEPLKPRSVSRDELPALLTELEASGESVAEFARRRGIATWKLYTARRKSSGGRRKGIQPDLVPVRVVESVQARPLELALASGHVLRVPPGFDETELRRLLGVLAAC